MLLWFVKAAISLSATFHPLTLPRAVGSDVLERLIPIQIHMLDNVIDVNNLPVKQSIHLEQTVPGNWFRNVWMASFTCHTEYLLGIR